MLASVKHRGLGTVFRLKYRDKKTGKLKDSKRWHIQYFVNGTPVRERTGSHNRMDAVNLLKARAGEAATGKRLPGDVARTTFDDLAALIRQDYEKHYRRMLDLAVVLKRLHGSFAGMKATDITAARINAHQVQQQRDGYKNATINRDIAALKRAFRLGLKHGLVGSVPAMERLDEHNVRTGFFEPHDFQTFLIHLPAGLHPLFKVAYITGWRIVSELLTREWRHVDFVNAKLRLDPGEAKDRREGREFPFTSELRSILAAQRTAANVLEKSKNTTVSHVFFRTDGTPIKSYRAAWATAVKESGVTRIPHDFRRTAVRNLEMAGVPRSLAMKMIGHKTESIYRRYAITDEGMLQDGARKLDAFLKSQAAQGRQRKSPRFGVREERNG